MEKWGVAGTFACSASLEKLFFHAVFHHQLRLRFEAWPILNPSILLSRVKLNRRNSNRPIKNRKKKQNSKSHDLNQMILWLSMCLERIVCGNMWSRIEQNKEERKGRKRETGAEKQRFIQARWVTQTSGHLGWGVESVSCLPHSEGKKNEPNLKKLKTKTFPTKH